MLAWIFCAGIPTATHAQPEHHAADSTSVLIVVSNDEPSFADSASRNGRMYLHAVIYLRAQPGGGRIVAKVRPSALNAHLLYEVLSVARRQARISPGKRDHFIVLGVDRAVVPPPRGIQARLNELLARLRSQFHQSGSTPRAELLVRNPASYFPPRRDDR